MQVQQITVFLVACTLSVLVVAYAQEDAETVLLNRLRDIAARAATGELPDFFADVDDYKRGVSISTFYLNHCICPSNKSLLFV